LRTDSHPGTFWRQRDIPGKTLADARESRFESVERWRKPEQQREGWPGLDCLV
jgi:hypothetical protein